MDKNSSTIMSDYVLAWCKEVSADASSMSIQHNRDFSRCRKLEPGELMMGNSICTDLAEAYAHLDELKERLEDEWVHTHLLKCDESSCTPEDDCCCECSSE